MCPPLNSNIQGWTTNFFEVPDMFLIIIYIKIIATVPIKPKQKYIKTFFRQIFQQK